MGWFDGIANFAGNALKSVSGVVGGIVKATPIGGLVDVGSKLITGKSLEDNIAGIGSFIAGGSSTSEGITVAEATRQASSVAIDVRTQLDTAQVKFLAERSAAKEAASTIIAASSANLINPKNGYESALVSCLASKTALGFAPWSFSEPLANWYQLGTVVVGYQDGSSSRFPDTVSTTIAAPVSTFLGQKGNSDISARITAIAKFASVAGSVQNPLEVLDFFLYRDPDLVLSPWDSATGYVAKVTEAFRSAPAYKAMVKILRVCDNRAAILAPFRSLTAPWVSGEDPTTRLVIGAHPVFADMCTMAIFGVVGMEMLRYLAVAYFKPNSVALRTWQAAPGAALDSGAAPAAAVLSGQTFADASIEYNTIIGIIDAGGTIYAVRDALALRRIYIYQQWLSLKALAAPAAADNRKMVCLQYSLLCITQLELIAEIVESSLDAGLSTQDWRDIYDLLSRSEDPALNHIIAVSNEETAAVVSLGNSEVSDYIGSRSMEESRVPIIRAQSARGGNSAVDALKALQTAWATNPRPISLSSARVKLAMIRDEIDANNVNWDGAVLEQAEVLADRIDALINV